MALEIVITAIILEKIVLGVLVYKVWTADKAKSNAILANKIKNLPYKECPICLGEFTGADKINMLECNHCFHSECISRWKNHRVFDKGKLIVNGCPLCRQDITFKAKKSINN